MQLIKVASAVLNQTPLDWDANAENIAAAIQDAREMDAAILCLPELCISGYGCEDAFHAPSLQDTAWRVLEELLPETKGMIVSFGLPVLFQHGVFNTACLVVDGEIIGLSAKRHLAGDGLHYEPRWFKPWPRHTHAMLTAGGKAYPIGDIHFDIGGIKIGFEICEDAWVADRPGTDLALKGVDIILNPSASHFAFGKFDVRRRFVLEGSRAFGVGYIYSNLLGNEAGRAIYDGGALIAASGKMLAVGPRFSYRNRHVTAAVIDINAVRMNQSRTGSFSPQFDNARDECVAAAFTYPDIEPELAASHEENWERSDAIKEEEFARAVALGLFDYMRKSRSKGFVVSLSGGADSSACSCLVAMMVRFAVTELTLDGVLDTLNYFTELRDIVQALPAGSDAAAVLRAMTRRMLLCVYQGSKNSSDTTRHAAEKVAGEIGAEFMDVKIDEQVGDYVRMVENGIGRSLTWETDDIALQNIQARVRAPGVWMLANIRNALLVSTSNRSEAAVGYATMDGDTCGGISPIAGIDKAFLRKWLRWLESTGPDGIGALPALAYVNEQQPTAELRPQERNQTDEDDLMPYEVLEAVESAAVGDKKSPLESFRILRARFPGVDASELRVWIERFFTLWSRNQWKRERYAPSFHVDDKNLDPKTWCRFPILSGAYKRELRELKDYVDHLR